MEHLGSITFGAGSILGMGEFMNNVTMLGAREIGGYSYVKLSLGQVIAARLAQLKKNQAWLVRELNVRPNTVSAWINDKKPPTEDNMRRLSEVLGLELAYLYELRYQDYNPVDVIADIAEQRGRPGIRRALAALRAAGGDYRLNSRNFDPSLITDKQLRAFETLLTNLLLQHMAMTNDAIEEITNGKEH